MILAETRWRSSAGARALPYHVAPMPGGGVQIEYRGATSDLEIDIASDGQAGILLVEKGPNDEERYQARDNVTWQEVLETVASVVR